MEANRRPPTRCVLLLRAALVAAGCRSRTSASPPTAQPPNATTIAPTLAPGGSPTVDPGILARCGLSQAAPNTVTQAKDMLLAKPTSPLNYPSVQLPDQTPLQPLQVPTQNSNNALQSGHQLAPKTRTIGVLAAAANAFLISALASAASL